MHRHAGREMRVVVRAQGPDPDLEDLLLPAEVRIGLELEHAAREILDICVVAIVHAAYRTYALVQMAVAGAVFAEPRAHQPQSDPVRITATQVYRETERHCDGRGRFLDDDRFMAVNCGHRRQFDPVALA